MTNWRPIFCLAAFFFTAASLIAQDQVAAESGESLQSTLAEAKAQFAAADAELNRVYGKAKQELPEWKFELLKAEQKQWLEYRDDSAVTDAVFNGGQRFYQREKEAPEYWESLAMNSRTRSAMIAGWILAAEKHDGDVPWTGEWQDGYGGWLRIVLAETPAAAAGKKDDYAQPLGKMHFQLEVVRGPTYHLGSIGGQAKVNGAMAFFTDAGNVQPRLIDDGEETWLVFEKRYGVPQLEIRAANTGGYHGARAYFHGIYTRVGDLDADQRKVVIEGDDVE